MGVAGWLSFLRGQICRARHLLQVSDSPPVLREKPGKAGRRRREVDEELEKLS